MANKANKTGKPNVLVMWGDNIGQSNLSCYTRSLMGYRTGQFGKNHLGDRDEHLPTAHGFDEFFGNLYHLNAEEEPEEDETDRSFRSVSLQRQTESTWHPSTRSTQMNLISKRPWPCS